MGIVKIKCVDCDNQIEYTTQALIRCDDCLFNFIVKVGANEN